MASRRSISLSLLAAGTALVVTCCGRPSPTRVTSTAAAMAAKPHAPFAVGIVVDQLSAWVAASRLEEVPASGGFARLRREGTRLKNMRYPYAVTDTGPGHAALHTGKVPAESGIVGNELLDGHGGHYTLLRDDATRVVSPDGVLAITGSSSALLRADTVADRLRAAHPDALVVSVSLKDRAAIHGNLSIPELAPERVGVRCPSAASSRPPADPYGRPCGSGVRIDPHALERKLVTETRAALGGGHWIAGIVDPYLFLTPAARALDGEKRDDPK